MYFPGLVSKNFHDELTSVRGEHQYCLSTHFLCFRCKLIHTATRPSIMGPSLPAHASPVLSPDAPRFDRMPSDLDIHDRRDASTDGHGRPGSSSSSSNNHSHDSHFPHRAIMSMGFGGGAQNSFFQTPPPSLISPAFTPPGTPGTATPSYERPANSIPVDSTLSSTPAPRLLDALPNVNCVVRARIPTTISGQEMFLHLYTNDIDNKEHLAIVFGPHIRSQSLDRPRDGETEMDRMIRGAYTGRLFPGRTSSKLVEGGQSQASPVLKKMVKDKLGVRENAVGSGNKLVKDIEHAAHGTRASSGTNAVLQDSGEDSNEHSGSDTSIDDDPFATSPPLVRIHSECYTGETVWSARCDCGEQLEEAARLMSIPLPSDPSDRHSPKMPNPGGVIIYLRQEGRGIGLSEKLKAYNLQDLGSDTVDANLLLRHPADARSYGLATAMLVDLGLGGERGIRLLTNNPDKVRAVEGPGREVIVRERVAMVPLAWKTGGKQGVQGVELDKYLQTKVSTSLCQCAQTILIMFIFAERTHEPYVFIAE